MKDIKEKENRLQSKLSLRLRLSEIATFFIFEHCAVRQFSSHSVGRFCILQIPTYVPSNKMSMHVYTKHYI